MDTERLIEELVAATHPIIRPWRPGKRAAATLALTACVLALTVLFEGTRSDLPRLLAQLRFDLGFASAIATGVAAMYACFRSATPDAPGWIAFLPAAPFLLWVGTLGSGCLEEVFYHPDLMHLGTSFECLNTIVATSIPPGLVMVAMLRRVVPFHPRRVASLGALAVSSLASAALTLFHPLDSASMVLIWHVGYVLLVITLVSSCARPLLHDWAMDLVLPRQGRP